MRDIGEEPRNREPPLNDEDDIFMNGTYLSELPRHVNGRNSSHDQFNVHQPFYTNLSSESSDALTDDYKDEEVPANYVLEFSLDS
ncbi:hypothetical protein TNCV_635711 [Trichonephila clavipes]|nr:hypothetical protein TNCV_635711 [Trichonephila clavipes]